VIYLAITENSLLLDFLSQVHDDFVVKNYFPVILDN